MNELYEVIEKLFGPDPFYVQLVKSYVDSIKDYNDDVKLTRLLKIASDKEICSEFTRFLTNKKYDFEGALNIKGVTAKWIYDNTYYKDALKIYSSMVWAKQQLKDVDNNVDPSILYSVDSNTSPEEQAKQKYDIEPSKNHARIVYGTPDFMRKQQLEKMKQYQREQYEKNKEINDLLRKQHEQEKVENINPENLTEEQRQEFIKRKQEELIKRQQEEMLKAFQKDKPNNDENKAQEQAQRLKELQEEALKNQQKQD